MPERELPLYSESSPRIPEKRGDFLDERELPNTDGEGAIVVSQEEAEVEARRVLQKIKGMSSFDTNERFEPKTEKKNERLGKARAAVEILIEITREHSGRIRSFGDELKLVARGPKEFFLKTKAFFDLKVFQKEIRAALADPEERTEALRIINQMVNGIYGDENIQTHYRENADIARKVFGIAFSTVSSNKDLPTQEFGEEDEKLLWSILTGVAKYHYKGSLTNWKENPKIEGFFRSFSSFVQKQIETIKQNPEKYHKEIDDCTYALLPLIYKGEEFDSQSEKLLLDIFLIADNEEKKDDAIGSYKYRDVLLHLVDEIGIPSEKLNNPDKNAEYGERENFIKNFRALLALERATPGSVKKLWKEYGILTFARYPKELLLRQLSQEFDIDHPYGVVLYPREDWNGGFYSGKNALQDLSTSSEQLGVNVRVFECEGRIDMVKKLVRLERAYGEKQKIKFALIGGHGDKSSLQFAPDSAMIKEINKGNIIHSKALPELRSFFDPQATVILNSCSTGTDDGIGQTLSKLAHIRVIAPDFNCGLKKLALVQEGNNLNFEVEYSGSAYTRDYRS